MASRDCFDIEVTCPKCQNKGELNISENDYPFMRKFDRDARSTDGKFKVEMIDDTIIKLKCNSCGEVFIR